MHDALQSNYFGALRVLELAHECKHLESFVHVSTCYVNSNQPDSSVIMEQLYRPMDDPEEFVNKIVKMNP